jgi:hypothetical protein
MMLLILNQLGRLGEGHHGNGNTAPFELGALFPHLAEMRLAGQSRQVAEKNQQEIFVELAGEMDRLTLKISERQLCDVDVFQSVLIFVNFAFFAAKHRPH